MKIKWYSEAQLNLDQTEDYIFNSFGPDSLVDFVDKVDQSVDTILHYPNIGSVEPLLADRALTYRSLVVGKLSKIVYRVDDDTIHIVDFWDCRREPEVLADQVK
jgi:plasmid stabilization system protein ParE